MFRILLITLLLSACGSDGHDIIQDSPYLHISVSDELDIYDMNFEIYDPSSLVLTEGCDTCPYLAYADSDNRPDERLDMHFGFTEYLEDLTLEQLQSEFKHFGFSLEFPEADPFFHAPELLVELGKSITVARTDGLQLDLTEYRDGRLSGSVTGVMTELISLTMYSPCCEDTTPPLYGENVYLPFSIEFSLPVVVPVVPTDVD